MKESDSSKDGKKPQSNIDKIRDIIFGDEIQTLKEQMKALKQDYSRLEKKLDRLLDKVDESEKVASKSKKELQDFQSQKEKMDGKYKNLVKGLERKINELSESKVDKSQIGQVFIERGMKVKENSEK